MHLRLLPHTPNPSALEYVSGRKIRTLPWAQISDDPSSWIEPECVPDGFQWADPSKIRIGNIFPLLKHWRERHGQRLSPLIWVTTCPLLRHASLSFEDHQGYHSDHSTGSSSSDHARPEPSSPDPPPNSDTSRLNSILDFDVD